MLGGPNGARDGNRVYIKRREDLVTGENLLEGAWMGRGKSIPHVCTDKTAKRHISEEENIA